MSAKKRGLGKGLGALTTISPIKAPKPFPNPRFFAGSMALACAFLWLPM